MRQRERGWQELSELREREGTWQALSELRKRERVGKYIDSWWRGCSTKRYINNTIDNNTIDIDKTAVNILLMEDF